MPDASPRLPRHLLHCTATDGELVPLWLSARDRPWLRDLLLDAAAFVGRPAADLLHRWRVSSPDPRAGRQLAVARWLLLRRMTPRRRAGRDAAARRRELFLQAAAAGPDQARADVAASRRPPAMAAMFDDLPHAQPLCWPQHPFTADDLMLGIHRAMAQALLCTADDAELTLQGAARLVLRTAWLRGGSFELLNMDGCSARLRWRDPAGSGRRLAALVPVLPWANAFELRARCRWRQQSGWFVLTSHDALAPGPEPRPFDSRLERAFAAAWAQLAPDWQLLREPAPLALGRQLAFPDFLLRSPRGDEYWLEIAGLRDPAALAGKLALLHQRTNYLLCVPERWLPASLADPVRVLPFARTVDAAAVLTRIRRLAAREPI